MSSIKLILFMILAVFTLNIASEITVLTPNSKFYGVVNETLSITWKSSGGDVPHDVTIKLISKTSTSLFTGEYAVGQSIPTASGNYAWSITDNLVGDNWILKFYNSLSELNDKTPTVAQSDEFSIKPAGTKPPANDTSTTTTKKSDSNNITSFSSSLFIILFASFISSIIIIHQY